MKDSMFRFAKRFLGSNEEAEDVVQDLMLKFWQTKDQLLVFTNLKSYIMKSVKNECLNRLKHESIKRKFSTEAIKKENSYHIEPNNMREKILGFIEKLPEKQKWVIHLKDVEEYDVKEIAEILGIEENAVRVNLARARNKVKGNIQQLMNFENQCLDRNESTGFLTHKNKN